MLPQSGGKEILGLDSESFLPKNGVLQVESAQSTSHSVRCHGCNKIISTVSTTLYEIDNNHYCSECYSQKIITLAVERDHNDLKSGKARKITK